jgi:hypothetical protein
MTKEILTTLINNSLKQHGFKKKGLSWYKENSETITVFSLDRSRWGGELYYVYLCVNFKGIDPQLRPKYYKCHSVLRAERIGEDTNDYLDFEKDIKETERIEKIEKLLNKSLVFLDAMSTIDTFKRLLIQHNPRFFMVKKEAQKYLGIKID